METKPAVPATALPSIAEIYGNDLMPVIQKDALFQVLVNQPPKPEWIKDHPSAKKKVIVNGREEYVPMKYIPIERVEWLIINICLKYKVEIKDAKLLGNSIMVTVRLHYYDHSSKEWLWQDGIGAAPLQTDKGAGAIEFDKLKSGAVQMGAPAAESYAVKDAAEKIGKIFGKDLNRDTVISYDSLADRYDKAVN